MVRIVASPRRRRRLAWAAGSLAAAGTVVGTLLALVPTVNAPSAAPPPGAPPAVHVVQPRTVRLSAADRRRIAGTLLSFLDTAVIRVDTGRSYDLVTPRLRTGYTRAQWAGGTIPVVPFPRRSQLTAFTVTGSFRNDVLTRVKLVPPAGSSLRAESFDAELRAAGTGTHRRWLVDSWTPSLTPDTSPDGPPVGPPLPPTRARLGRAWLLLPLGLLTLGMLVPLGYLAAQTRRRRLPV
jgi:hypothetical protein